MSASDIQITKNGGYITSFVIIASATFESQLSALPGSFSFTCKDPDNVLSFTTGDEISLIVDGAKLYGGYITQISRTYAFDADDTSITPFQHRYWTIRGVDYNILFDKRFVRNTADYTTQIEINNQHMDGYWLTDLLNNYIDLPYGFDTSTYMQDIMYQTNSKNNFAGPTADLMYWQQGWTLRKAFENFSKVSGGIFYIDANKAFHYQSVENVEHRWGLSDTPNYNAITNSPALFQGSTIGFREMEAIEDGSVIVNDSLVWGGAQFTPESIVFARVQDAVDQLSETSASHIEHGSVLSNSSIDIHGRWQRGETFFDNEHGILATVLVRANNIVKGDPGGVELPGTGWDPDRGLRYPQWTIDCTWFGKDVPLLDDWPDHIHPGQFVPIEMHVFSPDGGTTSLVKEMPCRSITISFPTGTADGAAHVAFRGTFGLQMDDPHWYWSYIIASTNRVTAAASTPPTADNGSTSTVLGALGDFIPSPAPDGSTTEFLLPFGYIPATLEVYLNGLLQRTGIDFGETDPVAGLFTMTSAPFSSDVLHVYCRTLSV
jgi:hypothetical protein